MIGRNLTIMYSDERICNDFKLRESLRRKRKCDEKRQAGSEEFERFSTIQISFKKSLSRLINSTRPTECSKQKQNFSKLKQADKQSLPLSSLFSRGFEGSLGRNCATKGQRMHQNRMSMSDSQQQISTKWKQQAKRILLQRSLSVNQQLPTISKQSPSLFSFGGASKVNRKSAMEAQRKYQLWLAKATALLFVLISISSSSDCVDASPILIQEQQLIDSLLPVANVGEIVPEQDDSPLAEFYELPFEKDRATENSLPSSFEREPTEDDQSQPVGNDLKEDSELAGNQQELYAIQRRRLNRDRALEPEPWFREQPMRRGYNPASAPAEGELEEQRRRRDDGNDSTELPVSDSDIEQAEPDDRLAGSLVSAGNGVYDEEVGQEKGSGKFQATPVQPKASLESFLNELGEKFDQLRRNLGRKEPTFSEQLFVDNDGDDDDQNQNRIGQENSQKLQQVAEKRVLDNLAASNQEEGDDNEDGLSERAEVDRNQIESFYDWLTKQSALESGELPMNLMRRRRRGEPEANYQVQFGRLAAVALELKFKIESSLPISRGSIQGLYPLSDERLLIKLNVENLSRQEILNMMENYDYARGFIIVSWPKGSKQNPIPLLTSILRYWVSKSSSNELVPAGGAGDSVLNSLPYLADERPEAANLGVEAAILELDDKDEESDGGSDIVSDKPIAGNHEQPMAYNVRDESSAIKLIRSAGDGFARGPQQGALAGGRFYKVRKQPQQLQRRPMFSDGSMVLAKMLAAYMNSIYTPAAFDYARQMESAAAFRQAPALPAAKKHKFAARTSSGEEDSPAASRWSSWSSDLLRNYNSIHLFAMMLAILVAVLAIKFVTRDSSERPSILRGVGGGQMNFAPSAGGPFKSFWSSSSSVVTGAGERGDNQSANLIRRKLSEADSLRDGTSILHDDDDDERGQQMNKGKSFDLLSQKLAQLLKSASNCAAKGQLKKESTKELGSGKGICADDSSAKLFAESSSLVDIEANSSVDFDCSASGQNIRSSRSYIKSLIDVLSNARTQLPYQAMGRQSMGATQATAKTNYQQLNECVELENEQLEQQFEEAEIVMSQMDISAAHLILAYMEKHLEDKERLRREWLEMNKAEQATAEIIARADLEPNSKQGRRVRKISEAEPSSSSKANLGPRAMLQKTARVALIEENRAKNRNAQIVPYDKNRVKLGSTAAGADSKTANGCEPKRFVSGSDYINASYIFDDDPRRPTHIIAQGPTEQTVGQFWQMIWDQGISVIVMLTRLNENNIKMCQCYWPTTANNSSQQTNAASGAARKLDPTSANSNQAAQSDTVSASSGSDSSTKTPSSGRRGSVTSVFNGVASMKQQVSLTSSPPNGNSPIIANGELIDNMLTFDIPMLVVDQQQPLVSAADDDDDEKTTTATVNGSSERLTKCFKDQLQPQVIRFEVHLVSEHVSSNDYLVRNMYLINRTTGETRTITQFHYLAWPFNGVPKNVKSLLQFRRKVHKSYRSLKSPILVHSGDGSGRSGTYTLIDLILERIKNGAKEIDPLATLEHLRDQRVGLCSNQTQFEFVLVALAEEIQIILNALPK